MINNLVEQYGALLGRILIASLFLYGVYSKLAGQEGFIGFMVGGGVPEFMFYPLVAFELIAGLAILVGWQFRYAALALAGFSLITAIMYHQPPEQMTMFIKNVAIAGGLFGFAAFGAGPMSMDAKRA